MKGWLKAVDRKIDWKVLQPSPGIASDSKYIMPGCCKTTSTWAQNLKVGPEYRQYTIQLVRDIGCICEEYRIYVNGHEMDHHKLTYNPCSPLCFNGGQFEWEQDGHSFLIIYNSLSWTNYFGGFRLFIDGVDVNTGREFSSFWRRRGWQIVFAGLVMLLLGITLSLLSHYVMPRRPARIFVSVGYALVITGVIYSLLGLIPVFRYRKPRYDRSAAVEYTANIVWVPENFTYLAKACFRGSKIQQLARYI